MVVAVLYDNYNNNFLWSDWFWPDRKPDYCKVLGYGRVWSRVRDLPERIAAAAAVLGDGRAAGHENAGGRVLVGPDLPGRVQRFPVRRVPVGPVVRHHTLAVARVHGVAQSQVHVHAGGRDLVTVPVARERPFDRVAPAGWGLVGCLIDYF